MSQKPDKNKIDGVAAAYQKFQDSPKELIVPRGIAGRLPTTRNMDIAPQEIFRDGGHKISVSQYLIAHASATRPPKTEEEVWQRMEAFMEFCREWKVPPTLSGFSIWNGMSIVDFGIMVRNTNHPERSAALALCKEIIRNFLEMAAFDNTLNPIVFFHEHKVFFGAVEQQSVTVEVHDNSREITPDELQARVISLVEGPDGAWAMPDSED